MTVRNQLLRGHVSEVVVLSYLVYFTVPVVDYFGLQEAHVHNTRPAAAALSSETASTMPLNTPRKVVPLNTGDDGPSRRSAPILTKRAFFCGVVVEGPNDAADLSEGADRLFLSRTPAERRKDVQDLVASLGDKIPSAKDYDTARPAPASSAQV